MTLFPIYKNMRSFLKMKSSQNGEITLSITDKGKLCTSRKLLAPQKMSFNLKAICEKKLPKFPDLQYLQFKRIQKHV